MACESQAYGQNDEMMQRLAMLDEGPSLFAPVPN